jgi:predicted dehydrogenase
VKGILVGLGFAGWGWYRRMRDRGLLAAVVDVNPEMRAKMGDDPFPFYTSLEEAFEREKADFLVNVTRPMEHTAVNLAAFDRGLPVLSEKPIAFLYEESLQVVQRANKESIPFMIGENYRRYPFFRKMKQLLEQGAIGRISTVDMSFYRYHQVERSYPVHILDDISVHYLDLIRYLTGQEGKRIQSRLYNPPDSWAQGEEMLSANVWLEMDNGIVVHMLSTITARGRETQWSGDWRIEGTEGALELINREIYMTKDGQTWRIDDWSGVDETDALDEFIASLREAREAETSGKDYLKTQALVHYAKLSNETGRIEEVVIPSI